MTIKVTIFRNINDEWFKSVKSFDSWEEAVNFMNDFEKYNKFVKFQVLLIREDPK